MIRYVDFHQSSVHLVAIASASEFTGMFVAARQMYYIVYVTPITAGEPTSAKTCWELLTDLGLEWDMTGLWLFDKKKIYYTY